MNDENKINDNLNTINDDDLYKIYFEKEKGLSQTKIDYFVNLRKEKFLSNVKGLLNSLLESNFHHWTQFELNKIDLTNVYDIYNIGFFEDIENQLRGNVLIRNVVIKDGREYESFLFNFKFCKFKIEITKDFSKIIDHQEDLYGILFLYHNEDLVFHTLLISKVRSRYERIFEFSDLIVFKKGDWISDLELLNKHVDTINYIIRNSIHNCRDEYNPTSMLHYKNYYSNYYYDISFPLQLKMENFSISLEDLDSYHDLIKIKMKNKIKEFIIKHFIKLIKDPMFIIFIFLIIIILFGVLSGKSVEYYIRLL